MSKVRKPLLVIVLVFIVYAVINDPTQSASVTANAWDQIKEVGHSIGTFFDTLLRS